MNGIISKIKGLVSDTKKKLQVLERPPEAETFRIWKYPDEEIYWGSPYIIKEWEVGIFYRDGQYFDVLPSGTDILTTKLVPKLTEKFRLRDDVSPFRCMFYFVDMRQYTTLFGGHTYVKAEDLHINFGFNGYAYQRIKDPGMFLHQLAANSVFTNEEIATFMKGKVNDKLIGYFPRYTWDQIFYEGAKDKVSAKARDDLRDAFGDLGLELMDVNFTTLEAMSNIDVVMINMLRSGVPPSEVAQRVSGMYMTRDLKEAQPGVAPAVAVGLVTQVAAQPPSPREPPLVELERKYADGKISEEEFKKRKAVLTGQKSGD